MNGYNLTDEEMNQLAERIRYPAGIMVDKAKDRHVSGQWQARDNSRADRPQKENKHSSGSTGSQAGIRGYHHMRDAVHRRESRKDKSIGNVISRVENYVFERPLAILGIICACYIMFKLGMAFGS